MLRTKLFAIGTAICILCLAGCGTPDYLPKLEQIDAATLGAYIKVKPDKGKMVKGELIALDSLNMIIQTTEEDHKKAVVLRLENVTTYELLMARPANYIWTIPTFSVLAVSHGLFGIFTLPANLIVTSSVTVGARNALTLDSSNSTFDELRPFARFPQGLPPTIKPEQLK